MPKLIDISVPIQPGMPLWPDSEPLEVRQLARLSDGDIANITGLYTGSHTGTHIDAPLHFIDGGKTTEEIPLETLVGTCQVLDMRGKRHISAEDLVEAGIFPHVDKLLFKTDNSRLWAQPTHPFHHDFCALTLDAAEWVVEQKIRLVGIDYLSIQRFHDPFDTHVELLRSEVVILEGLDLRFVEPNIYKLICLPLKVRSVEGMMARAVLETI